MNTTATTTDYFNGFIYENDTLQLFPTEEGRVRYVPAHGTTAAAYVYDYFLKDHLGDIRVVLTEQTDFSQYMATMETQNAQTEDALFANVESTREAKPMDYPQDETTTPNTAVAKLNGSDPDKRVGPSIILKVMAGDTIEAAVRAFYRQQATTQNNAGVPAEDMVASLMQALSLPQAAAASTHAANPQARLAEPRGGLTSNDLNDLKEKDPNTQREDKPKAYLNYVFFDNQFNFVEDGSGVKQVDSDPNQLETLASGKVVAKENGYVYVYTSNESQQDVLFDNMGVTDITGPVLEETHYYPFGLTMAGISTTAPLKLENRFKYNGVELNHKEFSDGTGLELYTAQFRGLDPQIGRWWQIDPKLTEFESPYVSMSNNPIRYSDLLGDTIIDDQIKNSKVWGDAYQLWSESDAGKLFRKLFGKGGKYGNITVDFIIGETPDEGGMKADGNTKVSLVNRNTGSSTTLKSDFVYKGIKSIAKGEGQSQYLKFNITMDESMPQRNGLIFTIENAEAILHETQHVRIDRQTLETQGAIQIPYYQHKDWMKPSNSSWYQERSNFYLQNPNYWKQDYERQKNQGKVSNVNSYIDSKINDFVN